MISKLQHHQIARLVQKGQQYNLVGSIRWRKLDGLISSFLAQAHGINYFEFIQTPGGFLEFDFPLKWQYNLDPVVAEKEYINDLQQAAEDVINKYFKRLSSRVMTKLRETAHYFTIGIDGRNSNFQHIELVAIYDLKAAKVIHWTGKFYPTESQRKDLIKFNDLESHFLTLNKQRILILGCHDLNVFNPRGQANANPNGWKRQTADKFKTLCREFKPTIVLQHPHTTDTPKIWRAAWKQLERELPTVQHYASGINFYNHGSPTRDTLVNVLQKTKKGDVLDFQYQKQKSLLRLIVGN